MKSLNVLDPPRSLGDGIAFGMGVAASRSAQMTLVSVETAWTPRQRDRRQAIGELLSAVTRSLDRNDAALMRGAFEDALRRIVPVRAVQLRDAASRWTRRTDGTAIESIA